MADQMPQWLAAIVMLGLAGGVTAAFLVAAAVVIWIRRRVRRATRKRQRQDLHAAGASFNAASRLVQRADLLALRQALDAGLNCNMRSRFGFDLLMVAAARGNTAIGELLLSKGADVNHVSLGGWTAVSVASMNGHIRFLKLLLEHGADPNSTCENKPIGDWLSGSNADAVCALLAEYRAKQSNPST